MSLPDSSILTNIHFTGNAKPGNLLFEKKYISVRCMENRLYSDDEVLLLPDISRDHPHYKEWLIRKRSSERFIRYCATKKSTLKVLEVGCGNGWLAHSIAAIPGTEVIGLDINFTELQQAARVFNEDPHLRFIYGDINTGISVDQCFDLIVFSASIQYFRSLRKLLATCLKQLNPGGEIHILDSPFYKTAELPTARKRTLDYYTSMGYPEMADYYFHHDIQELQAFHCNLLHNPHVFTHRLLHKNNPFYWICVKPNHK